MISKEHKKHADINKPDYGNFCRNEWAIVGSPCVYIKALADNTIKALSPLYKCGYADALHTDAISLLPGRLASGAQMEYTDQLNCGQINFDSHSNPYKFRHLFNEMDLVLVNGNHHQAKAQVVIIDNNKKSSLLKRIKQLTNVQLILLADNATDVFDYIKEAIPHWQTLPLYKLSETAKIISFFEAKMHQAQPKLNGLVLAGGKSIRMGFDKTSVNWYGKEQRYYMADLLKNYCDEVFISCRGEQTQNINPGYHVLEDTFIGLGPFGGILSAFRKQPDRAWLVVACDLPLLDGATLSYLVSHRMVSKVATAFNSPDNEFPEPLITIWEPKSYLVLLSFLAQGYTCPRKVLINNDIHLLQAPNTGVLTNVNTQAELEKVKRFIHQKIASA